MWIHSCFFFSFFFFSLCIFFKHKSNCWWNVFQLCKLRVSPGQDKVRTWFAHVHRKGHLEVCTVWYLHDMIIPFRYLIHIWFLLFFYRRTYTSAKTTTWVKWWMNMVCLLSQQCHLWIKSWQIIHSSSKVLESYHGTVTLVTGTLL